MRSRSTSSSAGHRRFGLRSMRLLLVFGLVMTGLVAPSAPAGANFSPWESLGGTLVGEPASVSWGNGRIDVFARGVDNRLYHQWFENGWHGWENLGGSLASAPAVSSWSPGRLDVFARGSSGNLIHRFFDTRWSAWESLSGPGDMASAPTATSWAWGRVDVFATAPSNGHLLHKFFGFQYGTWSGWEDLGGVVVGAPAAGSGTPDHLDIVVRGTDDAMHHKAYTPFGWSGWYKVGGTLTASPAVVSLPGGVIETVVVGAGQALYRQTAFGGWLGWQPLGGVATSGPAIASWEAGRIDIFVRGTDGALWHTWDRSPMGNGPAPPWGSGLGRRIVYCNSCQRAWHIDDNGDWYTFQVSGKVGVPAPGLYRVVRRVNPGGSGSLILPYFVGFAFGTTSDIGFHGIPLRPDGSPIESDAELGQFRSHGCVRESQADAVRTWNFGTLGTPVIVTP